MSNAQLKEAFAPRRHLQRTLRYRPHLRWAYYSLLAAAAIFWVTYVLVTAPKLSEISLTTIFECLGPSSFLSLIMYLEARFLMKPMAFSTIHVFNDRLEIERMGQLIKIPFEDVQGVQFRYLPYSGGHFNLCTSDKKYNFTVALERSEYILEAVAAFNPDLVSAEKLEAYRRTAVASDHAFAHRYDNLKNKKRLLLKFVGTPIVAAVALRAVSFFKGNPFVFKNLVSTIVVLILFQFAAAMVGNWIASVFLTVKTRKRLIQNPNHLLRDHEYEKRMEFVNQTAQKILFAGSVGAILISILLK